MTINEIPDLASGLAEQIRSRLPPVQRVESPADADIALLFEMQAVMAAALADLVRDRVRGSLPTLGENLGSGYDTANKSVA